MATTNAFSDKTVLVTGASAGIGAATAKAFATQGAQLILADINPAGENLAESIRDNGGNATFHSCDVSSADSVATLFEFIRNEFGDLHIAFNNAGVEFEDAKLADGVEEVFDNIMDINVKGVWLCMKHEITTMLASGGGAIVNTASVAGLGGAPTMSIYSASKHAVLGFTRSAAVEYAKKGIRVNAVCPGVIDTEMYRRAIEGNPRKALAVDSLHPVGRVGKAEEVAAAVLYLSADTAGFTTGIALPVDGGATSV